MIKNNHFFINSLKNIVIIGESQILDEIIKINKRNKLITQVITSSDQSKTINKNINYKIFNKIDKSFKSFVSKNFLIENTLFISLGSRIVFGSKDIKNFFKNNLINFHGTRLPLDAGAATHSWRIMREDRIDIQLAHVIDENIDTGGIIEFKLSLYPKDCKVPSNYEDVRLKKFKIFYETLIKDIKNKKKFFLKNQVNFLGRYNPRLNTNENGYIDWKLDSYDLYNFINAFDEPYDGASTYLNSGKFGKLKIKSVHLHGGDSSNHPFMSGLISRHDKDWIVVSTKGKHMLLIEKVLDKNKNNIISKIKIGDRFITPSSKLDAAVSKRVKVNAKGFN